MPCGATQDGRVTVERSDRMWSTGEGNGKPLQYSWLERKRIWTQSITGAPVKPEAEQSFTLGTLPSSSSSDLNCVPSLISVPPEISCLHGFSHILMISSSWPLAPTPFWVLDPCISNWLLNYFKFQLHLNFPHEARTSHIKLNQPSPSFLWSLHI